MAEALSEAPAAFQQFSLLDRIAIQHATLTRERQSLEVSNGPIMPATISVLTFFSESICGRYLSSRRIREKHPTAFAPWGPLCTADGDAPLLNAARLRHEDLDSRVLTGEGRELQCTHRCPHSSHSAAAPLTVFFYTGRLPPVLPNTDPVAERARERDSQSL